MECTNKELSKAVCHKICKTSYKKCPDYNRLLSARVIEEPCDKTDAQGKSFNETVYNSETNRIRCKECSEHATCNAVLSPQLVNALLLDPTGKYRKYSEFSGCTVVHAPGYLTFDLKGNHEQPLQRVQTIQFLLWDNRGNDKDEACDMRIHYRLLVSDHEGDLISRDGKLYDTEGNPVSVRWRVLYDTLHRSFNGWQVFHLDEPVNIRYVRLHLISCADENRRCNIVRFGAYGKLLVGFELYQHLPTLMRTICNRPTPVISDAALDIDLNNDTIAKFPKELHNLVRAELNNIATSKCVKNKRYNELLRNLDNELNAIIAELQQHDERILQAKNEIHKNTRSILSYAGQVMWTSILWFFISTAISILASAKGYDISTPMIYHTLFWTGVITIAIIIPWAHNPIRITGHRIKKLKRILTRKNK